MIRRDVRKMRRRRFDPVHDSAARTVALLLALILVALAIAAIVEPSGGPTVGAKKSKSVLDEV